MERWAAEGRTWRSMGDLDGLCNGRDSEVVDSRTWKIGKKNRKKSIFNIQSS
jgi:hypothetical protein